MSIRNNRRRMIATAGLAAGFVASCNLVCAQIPCSYDVQIIASPLDCGLGTVNTFGLGLNEHAAVVGYYFCPLWDHDEAFVWTAKGGFVTLDRPPGVSSAIAVDINDDGVICGTALLSGLGFRGFVYEKGEWTILDPVVPDGGWSSAAAINNAGTVVGQRSITEDLSPQNAYIWSANEGFMDLGVMNGPNSTATDVNEKGDVCGWTGGNVFNSVGFVWNDRVLTMIEPIPRGDTSIPTGISLSNRLSGWGAIPQDGNQFGLPQAFLWDAGTFTMLGTLPQHLISAALDIRRDGTQLVGVSWIVDDNPNISHGFVWERGVMQNLDDLLPSRLEVSTRSAGATDNSGRIVADGTDTDNNAIVLLLTPAQALPGDLNGDCAVGVIDLLILLNSWGRCADCDDCDADLDSNCVVGVSDLLILLANWG